MARISLGYIHLSPEIRELALAYADQLEKDKKYSGEAPLDRLKRLVSELGRVGADLQYVEYVEQIIKHYKLINSVTPDHFNLVKRCFDKFSTVDLKKKYRLKMHTRDPKAEDEMTFCKWVINAMRYENYVKTHVFQHYVKKLNIRTCVYCNALYAITTEGKQDDAKAFYQLDHLWPKDGYPYLCTSFFNLQPSCGGCNGHKSTSAKLLPTDDLSIYNKKDGDKPSLSFTLALQSIKDYWKTGKDSQLRAELLAHDPKLVERYNNTFYINQLYAEFPDEIKLLLWRGRRYSKSYEKSLRKSFSALSHLITFDAYFYFWGVPRSHTKVFTMPLAKMKQDLVEIILKAYGKKG